MCCVATTVNTKFRARKECYARVGDECWYTQISRIVSDAHVSDLGTGEPNARHGATRNVSFFYI